MDHRNGKEINLAKPKTNYYQKSKQDTFHAKYDIWKTIRHKYKHLKS